MVFYSLSNLMCMCGKVVFNPNDRNISINFDVVQIDIMNNKNTEKYDGKLKFISYFNSTNIILIKFT